LSDFHMKLTKLAYSNSHINSRMKCNTNTSPSKKWTSVKARQTSYAKQLLFFIFPALLLSLGCQRVLYVPNSLNMPLLEQKSDYAFSLSSRPLAPLNGELQGSCALTDHLATMLNMEGVLHGNSQSLSTIRHRMAEAGLGAYGAFWKNPCQTNMLRVELFGGYGIGNGSYSTTYHGIFSTDSTLENSTGRYNKLFLQPAFGVKTRYAEFGLGLRLSKVHFQYYEDIRNGVKAESGTYDFATIEPMLRVAVGYKGINVAMLVGSTNPVSGHDDYADVAKGEWSKMQLFIAARYSKWNEKCPESPIVSMETADSSRTSEPIFIQIFQPNFSICLRQKGQMDSDTHTISFNGATLKENLQLNRTQFCVDLEAIPSADNRLTIKCNSDGKYSDNSLQMTIKDGKVERKFFIQQKEGETTELRFKL